MNETIKTYTEIDPSASPEGCPELEPWMAYVGDQPQEPFEGDDYYCQIAGMWCRGYGPHATEHRCIDVRTSRSKEHFSEHCRIRNYQEAPDAFKEWIKREFRKDFDPDETYVVIGADLKDLYEHNSK